MMTTWYPMITGCIYRRSSGGVGNVLGKLSESGCWEQTTVTRSRQSEIFKSLEEAEKFKKGKKPWLGEILWACVPPKNDAKLLGNHSIARLAVWLALWHSLALARKLLHIWTKCIFALNNHYYLEFRAQLMISKFSDEECDSLILADDLSIKLGLPECQSWSSSNLDCTILVQCQFIFLSIQDIFNQKISSSWGMTWRVKDYSATAPIRESYSFLAIYKILWYDY